MNDIFISYSTDDITKVTLIEEELKDNTNFRPVIIANRHEALKPLAKKVSDGITNSPIFLPILTSNSFKTQWINQEIGFASALGKKIVPIIEKNIMNDLKGFIHKQIDLPHSFDSNANKAQENKNFKECLKELIKDLEIEFSPKKKETISQKKGFDKILDHVERFKKDSDFLDKKNTFINSVDGLIAAKKEVSSLFSDIRYKVNLLEQKGFNFKIESEEGHNPFFILKSDGYSFRIVWAYRFGNSLKDSALTISYWKGSVTNDRRAYYFPGDEPKKESDAEYTFDVTEKNTLGWIDVKNNFYTSEELANQFIEWLISRVTKKRMDRASQSPQQF